MQRKCWQKSGGKRMFDIIVDLVSGILDWILNLLNKPETKEILKKILWTIIEEIIKILRSENGQSYQANTDY